MFPILVIIRRGFGGVSGIVYSKMKVSVFIFKKKLTISPFTVAAGQV